MNAPDVVVFVVFVSFAIDRIVNGLLFALSLSDVWKHFVADPNLETDYAKKIELGKMHKIIYFLFALILASVTVKYTDIRLLDALGVDNINNIIDFIITLIIIVAGSEFFERLLGMMNFNDKIKAENEPINVKGTIVIEQQSIQSHPDE